jgi:F0F1-type ATP synthase alpha subunit
MFAVTQGLCDDIAHTEIKQFDENLFRYVEEKDKNIVVAIATGEKMSDEMQERLRVLVEEFKKMR